MTFSYRTIVIVAVLFLGIGRRSRSICRQNVATSHLRSGGEKGWFRQIVNCHPAVLGESEISTIESTTQ